MEARIGDLADWRWLASSAGRALVERAAPADRSPRAIESLRRLGSAERVRLALLLCEARKRAAGRIERAEALLADPEGVQMASATDVARHKAGRFTEGTDGRGVLDLCCGIGGDAIALGEVGPVEAVDRSDVRAWMCEANARVLGVGRVRARVADVQHEELAGRLVHLDPQRRSEGRRRRRVEDLEPGIGFVRRVCEAARGGAVKLAPGVDAEDLPAGELEYVSRQGRMNQAVLWTGDLVRNARSATMIDGSGTPRTIGRRMGEAVAPIAVGQMGRFVHAVDPALERAGLLGEFGARTGLSMAHPSVGLFTSNELAGNIEGGRPWLTSFEVCARMGWRMRRVRGWLAAHDGGIVEVKTRGRACDPDRVQAELRGSGDTVYTVFVLRLGERVEAIITRRAGTGDAVRNKTPGKESPGVGG